MRIEIKITFTLAILCLIGNSLTNAYFAPLAIEKGVSESVVGLMIAIFSLIIIIVTPFYSTIIIKVGRKRMFLISLFLQVKTSLFTISF